MKRAEEAVDPGNFYEDSMLRFRKELPIERAALFMTCLKEQINTDGALALIAALRDDFKMSSEYVLRLAHAVPEERIKVNEIHAVRCVCMGFPRKSFCFHDFPRLLGSEVSNPLPEVMCRPSVEQHLGVAGPRCSVAPFGMRKPPSSPESGGSAATIVIDSIRLHESPARFIRVGFIPLPLLQVA